MSLPIVNATPQYELTIPSTGQNITYRPYLVKEEKVLLMAFESGDTKSTIRAMMDVIQSCVTQDINVKELATFDLEYIFLRIRSKSVGETSTVNAPCSKCETYNEINVNLEDVEIDTKASNGIIELTDSVSVEMRYLTYNDAITSNLDGEENMTVDTMIRIIGQCIKAILTTEQRFDTSEYSADEIQTFVENLTSEQFEKLSTFYKNAPTLTHTHEFKCTSCGFENKLVMTGISDFFG